MASKTDAYFSHIKECIHPHYLQDAGDKPPLRLKERMEGGKVVREMSFNFQGAAFCVNLDLPPPQRKKGDKKDPQSPRLFRFLEDEARPWAKKCDFVVFHRLPGGIYAYLIEFKSNNIDGPGIKAQLDSGLAWLRSLKKVIEHYGGQKRPLKAQRFVFSTNTNAGTFLDADGKYLTVDPSIRFYRYDDVAGLSLGELENNKVDTV